MNRFTSWITVKLIFLACTMTIANAGFYGDHGSRSKLIVFVHGIHNSGGSDPESAWARTGSITSWPKILRSDSNLFNSFDVYLYQYRDTDRNSGNIDIDTISRRMSAELNGIIERYGDVYIIAHSMGGLITRLSLLNNKNLDNKVRSIFLFATPMNGSGLARAARTIGWGSVQTLQLGERRENPDAIFNNIKSRWLMEKKTTKSYCAYESDATQLFSVIYTTIVDRSSVEPLCNADIRKLAGSHTDIILPPIAPDGNFEAHNLLKEWLKDFLGEFDTAAQANEDRAKIVIANCTANYAYRGPGRPHANIMRAINRYGVGEARYSAPMTQTWIGDNFRGDIYKNTPPNYIIIHFSCFQNLQEENRKSAADRDLSFLSFLRTFKDHKTKIIVYSRAFNSHIKCAYFNDLLRSSGLFNNYQSRIILVKFNENEVPGDNGPGDLGIVYALGNRAIDQPPMERECGILTR